MHGEGVRPLALGREAQRGRAECEGTVGGRAERCVGEAGAAEHEAVAVGDSVQLAPSSSLWKAPA
jgi:hypothetical protein